MLLKCFLFNLKCKKVNAIIITFYAVRCQINVSLNHLSHSRCKNKPQIHISLERNLKIRKCTLVFVLVTNDICSLYWELWDATNRWTFAIFNFKIYMYMYWTNEEQGRALTLSSSTSHSLRTNKIKFVMLFIFLPQHFTLKVLHISSRYHCFCSLYITSFERDV